MTSCLRNSGRILLRLTPAGSACACARQHIPFFGLILSHIVSVNSYQHERSSRFVFDFIKLNFCQHVFGLNFSISTCG